MLMYRTQPVSLQFVYVAIQRNNVIIYFKKSSSYKVCTYDEEQRQCTQRDETYAQLHNAMKIINSRNNHAQFTIYQFKTVINKEKPIENSLNLPSKTC